jgi:hypothetical protein
LSRKPRIKRCLLGFIRGCHSDNYRGCGIPLALIGAGL